jgi:hypothetical protein
LHNYKKYCSGNRAFLKKPLSELIYLDKKLQYQLLVGWLKGDGSSDNQFRLRGYTTSEDIYKFMELIATRLNYWNRCQVVFEGKKIDLKYLRNINKDLASVVDDTNCHAQFQLYFSPRDSAELHIDSGFSDSYPKKRKEIRKVSDYILHKVRGINAEFFNGRVFNLKVEEDNSFIVDGIVTHNCGHKDTPDSNKFIEASWVRQPAFTGAVLRSFVEPSEEIMAKIEAAKNIPSYKNKPGDYLKAAADMGLIAQEPPAGKVEPEEPAAEEDPDAPSKDAPEEETPPAEGETPAADEGPIPEELPPEPEPETEIKQLKKDLKKKIFKQVQDDVMKDLSEEEGAGAPRDLETLDETLIKPASLVMSKVWGSQKSWDRFVSQRIGSLNKKDYDRLRYGVHIAMTNTDLTILKEYGYSKRDFLAVLSFIDSCFKAQLPINVKKTIASLGGTQSKNPVELLKKVVSNLGRKVTAGEARKILAWLRLLDFYS